MTTGRAGQGVEPRGGWTHDQITVRELIWGFISSQVVGALAALGVADVLADDQLPCVEVAVRCGVPEDRLYRLLRAAASLEVLYEEPQRVFGLTGVGSLLRSDVPGSVHAQAVAFTDRWQWMPWGYFRECLTEGRPAAPQALGQELFEYLADHPSQERVFAAAMVRTSQAVQDRVLAAYDFSRFRYVVDIGGGEGEILRMLLMVHPTMRGVVLDMVHVITRVKASGIQGHLGGRLNFVAGDFFDSVPAGGDLYLLKLVLHDWDDAHARQILLNCTAAMAPGGSVMVIEGLVPPAGQTSVRAHRSDLDMLVINGGQERTLAEYEELFGDAGLVLDEVVPIGNEWALLVGGIARTDDHGS